MVWRRDSKKASALNFSNIGDSFAFSYHFFAVSTHWCFVFSESFIDHCRWSSRYTRSVSLQWSCGHWSSKPAMVIFVCCTTVPVPRTVGDSKNLACDWILSCLHLPSSMLKISIRTSTWKNLLKLQTALGLPISVSVDY